MEKLTTLTLKAVKETIEEIVNTPVYELNDNFWDEIQDPYCKEMEALMKNVKHILEKGFHASYNEIMDTLEVLEKDVRAYTGDYIKKLFRDINTNLMRRFNKEFSKDENGQPRNWIMVEEPKIRELHLKCKQNVENLFGQFKYINIPQ